MSEAHIYKAHRIHARQLARGPWVSLIVNVGRKTIATKDALTESVTRVPGEYECEDSAIQAARAYIDEEVKDAPD